MSQFVETRTKTFTNGVTAIGRGLRVKLSSGVLALAGVSDTSIGTARQRIAASVPGGIVLRNAQGTVTMVAAGAITQGSPVYAAASGKVDATGFILEGTAMSASTADGDFIEVMPAPESPNSVVADVQTVAAAGSAQGDAAALTGAVNVVTGADGTKGVVLPTAAVGLQVTVFNSVATNGLKVYPADSDKINEGTADAAISIEGKTTAQFIATAADNWAAIYTADT